MFKKTLLLSSLLFMSCSKTPRYASGELTAIDAKIKEMTSSSDRLLADTGSDSCAMDDVTEERLFSEIRSLENNKLPASKNTFNGLDLSKLPPHQAYYLEKNREWIIPKNTDLTGCNDLTCIFSKIYPDSKGLEGYLNYYIYLKMGYTLATSLPVPTVLLEPPRFSNKDILFSLDELKNFYYLSKTLPTSFHKMSTLSSLHRMPLNTLLPDTPENPDRSTACGVAGGYTDRGYVILMDKCLTRESKSLFAGNFFPLVTHEFAHRLDYTLLPEKKIISETPSWLVLSGWKMILHTDSQGKTTSKWAYHQPDASGGETPDGFYREYTAKSPVEDFADSVGYARYAPEDVAAKSPRKYAWIVKNVFGGRSYSSSGLTDSYAQMLTAAVLNELPNIISNCLQTPSAYNFTLAQEQEAIYKDYDPKLIQCIFGGADHVIKISTKDIKRNEPEACSFFQLGEPVVKKKVLTQLDELIKTDLGKNIEIGKQLLVIAEFTKRLKDDIDPREIFLACQDPEKIPPRGESHPPKDSIECFNNELTHEFKLIANEYAEKIPNQLRAHEDNYLMEHSYVNIKDSLTTLFGQIFIGSDLKIKNYALKHWQQCLEENALNQETSAELILYPYNGGSQYIKKSLLNCLNNGAISSIEDILEKSGKKIGITLSNANSKKFVLEMFLPLYTSTLQELVLKEKMVEATLIENLKSEATKNVFSMLVNDTSWIGTTSRSDTELYGICQDRAKESIEKEIEQEKAENFLFHRKNALWGDTLCSSVINNPKIVKLIEANHIAAVKKVLSKLSPLIVEVAGPTMNKCKNQFSKNSAIIIKSRNLCLTNPVTWGSIEQETLQEWIRNEKIDYIHFASRLGGDYLANNKGTLKDQAIKKMNAAK